MTFKPQAHWNVLQTTLNLRKLWANYVIIPQQQRKSAWTRNGGETLFLGPGSLILETVGFVYNLTNATERVGNAQTVSAETPRCHRKTAE